MAAWRCAPSEGTPSAPAAQCTRGSERNNWYLSCTHQRQYIANPCQGVRICYADLLELVHQDLNRLLALSDGEVEALVRETVKQMGSQENLKTRQLKKERSESRIMVIDKIITKLYSENICQG